MVFRPYDHPSLPGRHPSGCSVCGPFLSTVVTRGSRGSPAFRRVDVLLGFLLLPVSPWDFALPPLGLIGAGGHSFVHLHLGCSF